MGTMWKDKLPDALWADRTAYKTPLGMSPYQIVYGKTCHLPVELEFKAHWAIKRWNMDLEAVGVRRKMQLSELDEWRERAYHNEKRIKKKSFTPGDKVLLFNSRVKLFGHGKLQSKWEGPFTVVATSSHGVVTLQNDEGTLFKVNVQHFKIFLESDKSPEELDVIQFLIFP
jgi:hypothetical protein